MIDLKKRKYLYRMIYIENISHVLESGIMVSQSIIIDHNFIVK